MADAHELLGQPVLPNRIVLSKIHHAAFDNHLIGVDPDGRVHASERLLMLHDGPLLEQSLKAIAGTPIRPPRRKEDRRNRERLAARFEQFKRVAHRRPHRHFEVPVDAEGCLVEAKQHEAESLQAS